jgi:hypothetical protein
MSKTAVSAQRLPSSVLLVHAAIVITVRRVAKDFRPGADILMIYQSEHIGFHEQAQARYAQTPLPAMLLRSVQLLNRKSTCLAVSRESARE